MGQKAFNVEARESDRLRRVREGKLYIKGEDPRIDSLYWRWARRASALEEIDGDPAPPNMPEGIRKNPFLLFLTQYRQETFPPLSVGGFKMVVVSGAIQGIPLRVPPSIKLILKSKL